MKKVIVLLLLFVFQSKALMPPAFMRTVPPASGMYPMAVASIPKCGTELLRKCIRLMAGIELEHIEKDHLEPSETDLAEKKNLLTHMLPTQENINKLKAAGYKVIFIYRDPRDQSVSMIRMVHDMKWFPALMNLPFDQALSTWIADTSGLYWGDRQWINPELKNFKGIDDLYHRYLKWAECDKDFVYVTAFERLAGPNSGGTHEAQVQELQNIANHVGITISPEQIEAVANEVHGPIKPGRKQIGGWHKHFQDYHKEQFKHLAGDLLIELGYEKDLNW